MLLVIFGAGASYDSVPHIRPHFSDPIMDGEVFRSVPNRELSRPPLASQLFGDRPRFVHWMGLFKDCKPLITPLRQTHEVERLLASYQEQATGYPPLYRQLASIRYYLQHSIWDCQREWLKVHSGITNYGTLLHEIDPWRYESGEKICFVTFNYDTMLEDAMREVLRFEFLDLTSYITPDYVLIKLHGSTDWAREVDGISDAPERYTPQRLIDEIAELHISERYRRVATGQTVAENQVVFPALAIPVENKDEFSCPAEHQSKLEELLPGVEKIITIGWRATEQDFLEMLRSKLNRAPKKLMVVSGNLKGAEESLKNLASAIPRSDHKLLTSGFTELILNMVPLNAFLREPTKWG